MSDSNFSNFGPNSGYIQDMYELYLKDPKLVGPSWVNYFSQFKNETVNLTPVVSESFISEEVTSNGKNNNGRNRDS